MMIIYIVMFLMGTVFHATVSIMITIVILFPRDYSPARYRKQAL